jgi:diguanylate cyclase (GGDEF)-like protein
MNEKSPNTVENKGIDYQQFITSNRSKVNKYLNFVLWFFIGTGPIIALGVKLGIFHDISYTTCIVISIVMFLMSAIHFLLLKKFSDSIMTSLFALIALDGLILYMALFHVSIYLTWFLVPLLSILLVETRIFIFSVIFNYILMTASAYLTAPYYWAMQSNYETPTAYFLNTIGGFTIESTIMLISGIMIVYLTVNYLKSLTNQHIIISQNEANMKEKMEILDSMAEIYDNVNLIDFINNTEMSIRDKEQKKQGIDLSMQTHTLMNQEIKNKVMPDQLDDFMTFTDIKTVRSRLSHKKLISADFIDVVHGWFRAQYITVDATLDGIPNVVIFTTRNVDDEKRREEHLIRLSLTDELTRLYNRRCYEEDLGEFRRQGLNEKFVLFSIDVNGLKKVNDTLGHAAGDELIKGAADCLALSVRGKGKVYRTGGDEFFAIVHSDDPASISDDIATKASEWHGMHSKEMSLSVGYASLKEYPNCSIDELERKADAFMYEAKERYYKEKGIERRKS